MPLDVKSITVETSVQYSIQKHNNLTADRVMTANIKSLVFYVIMTPFPFYKNMLNFSGCSCSYKNGALLAKFQPGVLNPFVLICSCLLYSTLRFGGYLLRFHLSPDWSQNNKHSQNFLWCSRFYRKDCKNSTTEARLGG